MAIIITEDGKELITEDGKTIITEEGPVVTPGIFNFYALNRVYNFIAKKRVEDA